MNRRSGCQRERPGRVLGHSSRPEVGWDAASRLTSEMILIVAGVSGSGKTTVGALVAGRLHWRFADADTFHPASNVAKMRAGIPLTDADRWPWLQALRGRVGGRHPGGR